MGTKYSAVTVSSYNASPPADDGTQDASNQLNWSKHKTKLGDPLKTAIESINTNLVTALNQDVLAKTDSYNIVAADHDKTIVVTTTSAGANISLPDATGAGSGFITTIVNAADSTDALTIDLVTATDLMNGTTDGAISLPTKCALTFITNVGANGYNIKQAHGIAVADTKAAYIDSSSVSAGITRTLTAPNKNITIAGTSDISVDIETEDPSPDRGADYVRTYDSDSAGSKKVLLHRIGGIINGTESDTTAGTVVTYTGIPKWATRVTVQINAVSTASTDNLLVQLGTSAGVVTTGYSSSSAFVANGSATVASTSTSGMLIAGNAAGYLRYGQMVLTLFSADTNEWIASHSIGFAGANGASCGGGAVTLSEEITQIQISSTGGAFDNGSFVVSWE